MTELLTAALNGLCGLVLAGALIGGGIAALRKGQSK
jgi:hypothetical protein